MKTMKGHSESGSGSSRCERVHFIARKRYRWSTSGSVTGSKVHGVLSGFKMWINRCTVWSGSSLTHRVTLRKMMRYLFGLKGRERIRTHRYFWAHQLSFPEY